MREKEDGLTGRVNSSNAGLTYSVYWWRTWSRSRPRSLMSLSTVFVCVIVIPRGAENNLIYQGGIIPGGHYTRGALYQGGRKQLCVYTIINYTKQQQQQQQQQ